MLSLSLIVFVLFSVTLIINRIKLKERREKNKFKALFDNMNEGFGLHEILLDDEGHAYDYRFLEVNRAFEEITGFKYDEIKFKTAREILPDLEPYWVEAYGTVASQGHPISFNNYSLPLDKHFNVNVYSPSPNQFVTLFTDISFSVKAKEKIENERKMLEVILEDTLSGYWDFDFTQKSEYFSPSFKAMFGYTTDDFMDINVLWENLIFEEERSKVKKQYDAHIRTRGEVPFYVEVKYHHKNGSVIWVICSGRVVEWDGDLPVRMVGCHIDITQRKKLERQISDERNLFKTTLHSIGDGVISTDKTGRIQIMNSVAEQLTGWKNDEVTGQTLDSGFYIISDQTGKSLMPLMQKVLETNEKIEIEEQALLQTKNHVSIPIEVSAAPIKNENDILEGMVVVFKDCSEKKEKQEKIKFLSYHDRLTGLYNRHFFEEELKRLNAERNLPFTLAILDVNGLKLTNDAFGHEAGDLLLKKVSEILKRECRMDDIIARIGGDEFVILLPMTSNEEAEQISNRIYRAIENEKSERIVISVSIGLETRDSMEQSMKDVFSAAEDQMYHKKLTETQSMRNRTIRLLVETLYGSNKIEKIHSEKVSAICAQIGRGLKFDNDQIKELEIIGLMHDIGKIAISQEILNKKGRLTTTEYEEVKRHPEISYHILKSADSYAKYADSVLSHHERWDGSGYPRGISGEEIPLISRILAVADAYEAMTSKRYYKEAFTQLEALEELKRCAGTQFDPKIVSVFETCILESIH